MIQETPKDLLTKESIEHIIDALKQGIKYLKLDIESPDGLTESDKQNALEQHKKDLHAGTIVLQKFEKLAQEVATQVTANMDVITQRPSDELRTQVKSKQY